MIFESESERGKEMLTDMKLFSDDMSFYKANFHCHTTESDGHVTPQACVDFYADADGYPHMVQPEMLYLTHPTEYGTLYTKAELTALRQVAGEYDLPVFLDGARLGYALATPSSDVTLEDLARLTDCFSIGGTKVGALLGEAVVFPRGNAPKHFFTYIKQQGALLAKGRVLGLQFDTLFTDGLYQKIAAGAVRQADRIRAALGELGVPSAVPSPSSGRGSSGTPAQATRARSTTG